MALGAAGALAWLGRMLRAPGLAKTAARLARKAVEQVPRISERLLGAQEAALREVLRQLQSGDVEKALRRAPVAVPDPDQSGRIGTNAELGTRDPRYDLRSLIGSGGGPGTVWLGGGDVWAALVREYRRLADEAAKRGDFRRAAYLYGVLLRDLRSAANVLMTGGLFRDAARLYRDKLRDLPAAAVAFERAGEFDEALRIYERLGSFEEAAQLLRLLGDDARAVEFFTRAADRYAQAGRWVAAGDLLRAKAGRRDLAADYYRWGWTVNGAEGVACGERLLDEFLVGGNTPAARWLIVDAEERYAPPRTRDAARFFNHALAVSSDFLPAEDRDDLADRARLLFAAHLRAESGRASAWVDELFGHAGLWPGPVVRDATFAVRRPPRERPAVSHDPTIRLADGTVTAAVVVRETFDLIVATSTAVLYWRVDDGRIETLAPVRGEEVRAVASTPDGRHVYTLWADEVDGVGLCCYSAKSDGGFAKMGQARLWDVTEADWYVQPVAYYAISRHGEPVITAAWSSSRTALVGSFLLCEPMTQELPTSRNTRLLLGESGEGAWDWDDLFVRFRPPLMGPYKPRRWTPTWTPGVPESSTLATPPLDWLTPAGGVLEVVGPDRDGVLHWTEYDGRNPDTLARTASVAHPDGFTAACLTAPGLVAAVTGRNELHWLRAAGPTLTPRAAVRRLDVPARPVFLASRPHANEVVALFSDGTAVRVPLI
jgi:tetratricopeptide (TPR) repeat protein